MTTDHTDPFSRCEMKPIVQRFRTFAWAVAALALLSSAACGTAATSNAPAAETTAAAAPAASAATGGLAPFQFEHGIGPVTAPLTLAAVDKELAEKGEEVFEQKCASCHKMTERYVGPALGEVTKRRSPAFVMNMVLNPQGMVEKHPETKKLLAEFFVAMPNQNLTQDEARQVLEYLREQAH